MPLIKIQFDKAHQRSVLPYIPPPPLLNPVWLLKMDRRLMPLPGPSCYSRAPGPREESLRKHRIRSLDVTATEAQSVRRGLHLMPDCPNLLQNSGVNSPGPLTVGPGEQEMEREGTVIVPGPVEIFFRAALSKRKAVPWQSRQLGQNNPKNSVHSHMSNIQFTT